VAHLIVTPYRKCKGFIRETLGSVNAFSCEEPVLSGSQEFFNADQDVSLVIDNYRIGLQRSAASSDGKSVTQVENEMMYRADDFLCSYQPIDQCAGFVWTVRLGCVETGISRMEHSDELPADLENPTLAGLNLCQLAQVDHETS